MPRGPRLWQTHSCWSLSLQMVREISRGHKPHLFALILLWFERLLAEWLCLERILLLQLPEVRGTRCDGGPLKGGVQVPRLLVFGFFFFVFRSISRNMIKKQ